MYKINKRQLLAWGGWWLAAGIILAALLMAGARLLLPGVVDYRTDIEELAAETLGMPVTIERIETGWTGLRPVITLVDVRVPQPDNRAALRFSSLDVVLAIVPSLLAGEPRPAAIHAHMRRFDMYRTAEGRFSFNFGELKEPAGADPDWDQFYWLLRQSDFHIDIDTFNFMDEAGRLPAVVLRNVGIDLVSRVGNLAAELRISGSQLAEDISLVVNLDPKRLGSDGYKADAYLRLKAASLSFWKHALADTFQLPDRGTADVTVWMEIDAGKIKQAKGSLSLDQLAYHKAPRDKVFSIESMAGHFSWQATRSDWTLQISQLYFQRAGSRWPPATLSMEYRRERTNRFLVNVDYLRIQDFLPLLDRQPVIHNLIGDDLRMLAPAGEINDLKLRFSINQQEQLVDYALQADVVNFSANAHGQWPGVKRLGGYLVATQQAGLLQISTQNAVLDLRTMFREPLQFGTLRGKISWIWLSSGLLIESARLDANNAHISTQSRLSVHVPVEGPAFVNLQTNFKNGDGVYTSGYLPASMLGEKTLAWLDKSIVAGRVDYGSFILHGTVDDFPYDDNSGRFEVRFKVRDGILDYYKDWPRIEEIEAEVAFVGKSMSVEATSGRILGARLSDTVVGIEGLGSSNPMLAIQGRAEAPSKDFLRYLSATKLAGGFQAALAAVTLQGTNDLEIAIGIPMSAGKPTVKGQFEFIDNRLSVDGWGLHIDGLNGSLDFTEQSFAAADIVGMLDRRKLTANVVTLPMPDGPEVNINIRSRIDLSKIIQPGHAALAGRFSGESPFQALIRIPGTLPGRLTIRSSLLGTALKFPYPLGKRAEAELDFLLSTDFTGDTDQVLNLTLGKRLRAAFAINPDTQALLSSHVQLGDENKAVPTFDHKGLFLGGRLDYFDADSWSSWAGELGSGQKAGGKLPVFSTDIKVDRMKYAGRLINNFTAKAASGDQHWHANVTGEGAEGHIIYNMAGTTPLLRADLEHLVVFGRPVTPERQSPAAKPASTLTPADLPATNIRIDKLTYDERQLGSLTIATTLQQDRYQFEKIHLQTDKTELNITGNWLHKKNTAQADKRHATRLKIGIDSDDFGRFMERLGYVDTVKRGEASLQADISTETSPFDIEASRMSGEMRLSIRKGEVVEIAPGSAGRIFGLLSFQALRRRLSLDFTDIFSSGMSFDKIDGTFTINRGQAYTNNLTMDSPSSQIEVSGRVGLQDEDYDQHVRVTPNLSSTFPVAGALVGGLGLGAVMLITHQLLQDPIDKLTVFEYRIKGDWQSPGIESINDKAKAAVSKPSPADGDPAEDPL